MKTETDDLFLKYLDDIEEGREPDLSQPPYRDDPEIAEKVKKYRKIEEMFRKARGGAGGGPGSIKIPNLNITRLLGHGMGKVYLAHDTSLDREVAVKVIPKMEDNEQILKRFQQESKILARFTHPNIVVVYSHGETDEFYYYVMQYLEGLTLDKIIRHLKENRFARGSDAFQFASGRLADLPAKNRVRTILDDDFFRIVIDAARQACDGLAAAHRERVIHRDVKPQNILYDSHGMVKLMDFGISKLADGSIRTRTNEVLGSPYYISPEMIRKKEITERTDVYSLGVVLYELLALRPPFDGETLDQLYHEILESPAPDILKVNSDIPPPLAEIVHNCLKNNPAERYRTMKELKSDLDRVLETKLPGRARSELRSADSTGRRNCNKSDFARLLQFYLACIEEEDRHSLQLDLSQHRQSFISPWTDAEPLFHSEEPEVQLQLPAEDLPILTRGAARVGPSDKFYYGYPVFVDNRDKLSPLFVVEVELMPSSDGRYLMRPTDPNAVTVNHHIFAAQHFEAEERRTIQNELEGSYGSFAARLRAAIEHLGLDAKLFRPDRIDPLPDGRSESPRWINRPILFRSEKNQFTANLRKELDALTNNDELLARAMDTALGPILVPDKQTSAAPGGETETPVLEILSLNDQQELAAKSGLTRPLTVVTGPPGTGKSQVVVNLMASCAAAGKAVLFASRNNKAVDVVYERLREILGDDDWTLRLGNSRRMEECSKDITHRLTALAGRPKVSEGVASIEELLAIDKRIAAVRQEMSRLDETQNKMRVAEQAMLTAAESVPPSWTDATDPENLPVIPAARLQKSFGEVLAIAGLAPMGLWLRIQKLFLPRRLARKILKTFQECVLPTPGIVQKELSSGLTEPPDFSSLADAFQKLRDFTVWVEARRAYWAELNNIRNQPRAETLREKWQTLKREKTERSREALKFRWTGRIREKQDVAMHTARRFFDLAERVRYSKTGPQAKRMMEDFSRTIQTLGSFLPVWIVTNLSVRRALPLEPGLFDLVIIDEASQCDIPSAIPLLFRAKRALIIGDPNQLRHISGIRLDREIHIAAELGAEDLLTDWSYARSSLYDVSEAAVVGRESSTIFLAEHYRSHPDVIEFSNRVFYQGRLVLRTAVKSLEEKLHGQPLGVFWHDVKGQVPETRRSSINAAEVDAVVNLLSNWSSSGLLRNTALTFGVVTPFRGQMEKIEESIRRQPWWNEVQGRLTVGTAHLFQGDECDLMIFSPVVSDGIPDRLAKWVAETDQLLNVAVTRARGALHVVGNLDKCKKAGGYLGEFADYVDSGYVSGQTPSDIIEPSESKMAELLTKTGLWYHHHFRESRDELDFLVVSPFGARYDLEVDGAHHLSPEQLRADRVRDKRLESAGYKVVRVTARDVLKNEPAIAELLARLV